MITYNKKFLAQLKNNYFIARAMYETIKETSETEKEKGYTGQLIVT